MFLYFAAGRGASERGGPPDHRLLTSPSLILDIPQTFHHQGDDVIPSARSWISQAGLLPGSRPNNQTAT